MFRHIKRVFGFRGVLYLLTRFGGSIMRRCSFDEYYKSGRWDYLDSDHSAEIVRVVEKYANKGRILDMGCGTGILVSLLDADSFAYYRGVDASTEAIALAQKRKSENICFEISDIQNYKCKDTFDLIVFEESLYYVPFFRRRLLQRCAGWLRPEGLLIVTVADPRRFRGMIKMIRKNFQIVEDRCFAGSRRLLLVFH